MDPTERLLALAVRARIDAADAREFRRSFERLGEAGPRNCAQRNHVEWAALSGIADVVGSTRSRTSRAQACSRTSVACFD